MAGTLFLVATPIGNLADFTYRAVQTLRDVAYIACEDTRQTRKLLDHYGIKTPMLSYYEHNERGRSEELVARIQSGESMALVSDAGTPLVSDPGFRLVELAARSGIQVVPIPGPCAAIAGLTASGLPTDSFRYLGFLPPKSGQRQRELEGLQDAGETLIFYEAPHRIVETLEDIERVLGADRPVVVAREITKLHEEFLRGTASEVKVRLAARDSVKGEITLLIGKAPPRAATGNVKEEVEKLIAAGTPRMDAIKQVARQFGLGKREVYRLLEEA